MDDVSTIFENASRVATNAGTRIVEYIPTLVGAAIILLVGWIVARVLRAGMRRAGNGINRILDRTFRSGRLAEFRLSSRILAALGDVIYWLALFVFASIAARAAGLTMVASWLDRVVTYLPNMIAGVLVIVIGMFLGSLARDLAAGAAPTAGAGERALIGRAAQILVVVTALVIGLGQFGIDVTFLVTLLAVAAGALLGGFALAFALGARGYVENLIGAREIKREVEPGQVLRLGEIEGEVLEITATALVLATKRGRLRIPASRFTAEFVSVVDSDEPHD